MEVEIYLYVFGQNMSVWNILHMRLDSKDVDYAAGAISVDILILCLAWKLLESTLTDMMQTTDDKTLL